MFRGFVYRLVPTSEQNALMAQFAGVCRLIWDLALEQRHHHARRHREMTGDALNYVTQARELTAPRAEVDFMRAVHVTPQQRTLKALDEACRRAWKGPAAHPKRKGVDDASSFAGREIAVETINRRWGRVRVRKIGWVPFRRTRPIQGLIGEATVTRTVLGWQVSIGCLLDGVIPDNGLTVGTRPNATSAPSAGRSAPPRAASAALADGRRRSVGSRPTKQGRRAPASTGRMRSPRPSPGAMGVW